MSDRVGNVSRTRYEQLVTEALEQIAQVMRAQFALGDKALIIEPMRPVGGSQAKGSDDLFTVEEPLQMFADDTGASRATVHSEADLTWALITLMTRQSAGASLRLVEEALITPTRSSVDRRTRLLEALNVVSSFQPQADAWR
ncbi:hypothetical protein ACOMD4_10245 [Streptomyces anulatus]|uniref:hypothetical protein n=1 Tax=Streptomyces anulatus TaxID=1892 RepID=UPI003B81488E